MKPWMSWALLLVSTALIAFISSDKWLTRILLWLFITIPIAFWAFRKIAKSGA